MTLALQTPLSSLMSMLTRQHTSVGAAGELIVAHFLQLVGYDVSDVGKRADLTVFNKRGDIVHIEVKTARYTSGKWQFSLSRHGHTDHHKADIVILLCACKAGYVVPFVVPVSACWDVKQISMYSPSPASYSGKYAKYRQSIKTITLEPALKELGLSLE